MMFKVCDKCGVEGKRVIVDRHEAFEGEWQLLVNTEDGAHTDLCVPCALAWAKIRKPIMNKWLAEGK